MVAILLKLIHTAQAAFGAYNLYLASISIQNLQTYEDKAETAAKYSNIAEHQLHKSRSTQTSGTLAVLLSFISSVSLLVYGPQSLVGRLAVAAVNVAALGAARSHVGEYWRGKAKLPIPGLGKQNEATGKTQEVLFNMLYLMGSWIGVGVLALVV